MGRYGEALSIAERKILAAYLVPSARRRSVFESEPGAVESLLNSGHLTRQKDGALYLAEEGRQLGPAGRKAKLIELKRVMRQKGEGRRPAPPVRPYSIEVTVSGPSIARAAPAAELFARGAETWILTPHCAGGELATYALVEAEALVASHTANFQPNPAYPRGVQEREYHRDVGEQTKVTLGAQNLNPALLLSDTPTAVDGPPIVTNGPRPVVLGGNGRSLMLLRALREHPGRFAAYREALVAKLSAFGLESLAGFSSPVLVRVLEHVRSDAPVGELARAIRRFNESLTQALSPRARAVGEARSMSGETIEAIGALLAQAGEVSLRDVLRERPREFIELLRRDGVINGTNSALWIANGELTPEARDRVEGLFLGRVVGTGDRMATTPASLLAKVEAVVAPLLRVAGVNPGLDEIATVQAALDVLSDARRRGLTLGQRLAQTSFLESPVSPEVAAMARLLEGAKVSELRARFGSWAALAAHDPRQVTMFAAPATREEARAELFGGASARKAA